MIERKCDGRIIFPTEITYKCQNCGTPLDWSVEEIDGDIRFCIELCPVCRENATVTCAECGRELETFDKGDATGIELGVEVCPHCKREAEEASFEDGRGEKPGEYDNERGLI